MAAVEKNQTFAEIALHVARLLDQVATTLVASTTPIEAADKLPPIAHAIVKLARCSRQDEAFTRRCIELDAKPARDAEQATKSRAAARRHLIRAIEDSINEAPLHRLEYLLEDFHERLTDPLLEEDLLIRPIGEIIGELRRDLGLEYPTAKPIIRDAMDIAILAARAAAPPGAPLPRAPIPPAPPNTS